MRGSSIWCARRRICRKSSNKTCRHCMGAERRTDRMAAKSARKPVPGSEKQAPPKAKAAGKVDPGEHIEISVLLRPRTDTRGAIEARNFTSSDLGSRQYASREAMAAERGAAPDDIAKVEDFAREHHLTVVDVSIPRRTIKLSGSIADLEEAFQ